MATLFEIANEIIEFEIHLETALKESEGDINDDRVQALMSTFTDNYLQDKLEEKTDNYCQFIQELYARSEMRRKEGNRLLARAKIDENVASSLKERLILVMNNCQIKKMDTKRFRVSVCSASKGGIFINDFVPESYMKITAEPDKKKIRAAIEAGEEIPFASIAPPAQYLRIG